MREKVGLAALAIGGICLIVALVAGWFETREREANLRRLQEEEVQLQRQLDQLKEQIGTPKR